MRTRVHRSALVHAVVSLAAGGALLLGTPPANAAATVAAESNCNYIDDAARPTVNPGSTGDAVRQVQCLINYYSGYPNWLEEDGSYGSRTLAGVQWVQTCNGTAGGADGIVGPSTWPRLYTPMDACAI
ncbi:peptidoglycan-binding domain-containing protein [Streptomyces geranii]|uniref:peptidoglycan-binding domain-containing protein n=1 Tax=Streptomyces geranii TaxID=2058923 RepID=UPI000D02D048|nr:peptidoglycan-binding protein [Streptomyces geranii]